MELNLTVDHKTLDSDLQTIPNEVLVWSREAADRLAAVQRAEANLKRIEAEVSLKIRQNPTDYGYPKTTEDLIKSLVTIQPEVVAATEEVITTKHEANVARGIVDALEVKRSSLKYLAELTVAGFLCSQPVAPKGIK